MISDLRFAVRQLVKSPGYTLVVVLTLAFGIAVNTQIFSMVDGIFLRTKPVRDPGRLIAIVERSDLFNLPHPLSFLDFQDIRADSRALRDHIAFFSTAAHVSVPGQPPERLWVEAVTPDAFARLGVPVVLGRPLRPADGDMPPGTPVAVLTHRFWQNRLGGDPSIIGRTLIIDSKPFTVVGVARPGLDSFSSTYTVALFVPSGALPLMRADSDGFFKYRSACVWKILAYLQPGASIADANAELAVFAQRFARDYPEDHRNVRYQAVFERQARPDPSMTDFAPVFTALFVGLVALVLFIACANVANLMSARAVDRERELVVRAALGASRARLIRQLLVESVLLALVAGVIGFLLASWGGAYLAEFMPVGDMPVHRDSALGWQTWCFTAVTSLLAGVASGLFPALRASRIDLNESLKRGGHAATGGSHRFRDLLVVGQVATSCVVLIAAALFLRGLQAARDLDLGFRPARLLMLSFDLGLQGYNQDRGLRLQKQLLERVRALPGVEAASLGLHVPFGYNIVMRQHWPDNSRARLTDGHATVALSAVESDFLKTMGVPIRRGRDLLPTDDEHAPRVAVINEAMAKAFWPGLDPIGQHFHRDWTGSPPIEVVGVVATGKYVMITEESKPYYYTPIAQAYDSPATVVVRSAGDPRGLLRSVRDAMHALDPDLPVYGVGTMDEHLFSSFFALLPLRAGALLAGVQGGIGLLLAILGLYAVVSYGVRSRSREIGVRVALGASRADVMRFVSREGLRLTLIGLAAGLVLAVLLSFVLSHVLFGVRAADPLAFPAVVLLLGATAALACWLPARRATRVDPAIALRAE